MSAKLLATLPQQPLDPSTEMELATRKDDDSVNELVMPTMKQAILYMTRCCRGRLNQDELYSLAYSALFKAAKNFRPGGIRFFSYSKVYLRGEISREWRAKDVVRNSSLNETRSDELEVEPEEPSQDPEFELVDLHEKMEMVRPLFAKYLNEHERTIIALHYEAGLSSLR